ncbi:MAG TPA: PLD nuclease N-terminal domain-containing protein [Glaciihabitans sp.]|nr:PLD nuclease N-terminal domain-containing protein [Glaciihabitans sp.]
MSHKSSRRMLRNPAFWLAGAVQLTLAVTAWVDLARRPAAQVKGPKTAWAFVIAVNYIGPIVYFLRGRR